MAEQLDLTHQDEDYNLPVGAIYTVIDDGRMVVVTYSIRYPDDSEHEEPESEVGFWWMETDEVDKLTAWLNEI